MCVSLIVSKIGSGKGILDGDGWLDRKKEKE